MVLQPEIFLLDEPLSNLDARLREQIRREITTIHRESGATMIHVTHDQAEAMSLGRRIGVMARGRLLQVGTPLELYQRPANLQVATFMGNSPMNFLVGEIIVQQGQLFFHELTRHLGPGTALLPLTAAQVMQLSGLTHQRILLGIRPEHLTIRPAGPMPSPHPILRTTLKVVDHLGSESRLTVDTGTHSLVLRAPGWFPGIPQESVELLVQMEQAMFFEYREPSPLPDAGAIDQELWRIGCRALLGRIGNRTFQAERASIDSKAAPNLRANPGASIRTEASIRARKVWCSWRSRRGSSANSTARATYSAEL